MSNDRLTLTARDGDSILTAGPDRGADFQILDEPEVLSLDETRAAEAPAFIADRMSRLADELAALVGQVTTALTWQHQALAGVIASTPDGTQRLATASHVTTRSINSLSRVVLDALGEVHVTCDQLAHDLASAESGGHAADPASC